MVQYPLSECLSQDGLAVWFEYIPRVVRRIGGRKSHPGFHRVLTLSALHRLDSLQNLKGRCRATGRPGREAMTRYRSSCAWNWPPGRGGPDKKSARVAPRNAAPLGRKRPETRSGARPVTLAGGSANADPVPCAALGPGRDGAGTRRFDALGHHLDARDKEFLARLRLSHRKWRRRPIRPSSRPLPTALHSWQSTAGRLPMPARTASASS